MKHKGIKNLLIDFGGVLIDLDRQRCIENFRKLGVDHIDSMLNAYHQQGLFLQQEQGLITSDEFRAGIRRMTTNTLVSDERLDEAWNSFLVGIPSYKLDLLLKLRQKYVVYLLSNTNAIHWEWSCRNAFCYHTFKVEDYFEKIYLSYQMKMVKPHADIFEAVLADADIEPQETLFIDDSVENCRTAQTLGMATYTPVAGENWSSLFT